MQVTRVVKFIRKGEKGDKGDPGTNYLILGWWDDKISYMLSDLGIPVVKVADGTSLGYSAYSLDTGVSTPGASPSGAGSSEWRLVESAEFVYMQDAYIERLQAALVTADRIESLLIRTGNLEVLHGAKIAGLTVEGETLVSSNKRLVIDGVSNTIYLLDDNMNIKTVIKPGSLPSSVGDFFSGTGGGSASILGLKGELNNVITNLSSSSINLNASGGKTFEISIPSITLTAFIDYWGTGRSALSQVSLYLTNGTTKILLGSCTAISAGGLESNTRTTSAATLAVTSGGNWRLTAEIEISGFGETGTFSGSGTVASSATTFTASEIINRSEVGSNGMVIATSAQNYDFMVGGTHQIRRGNNMLQITGTQLRVSRDGGNSWTNLGS